MLYFNYAICDACGKIGGSSFKVTVSNRENRDDVRIFDLCEKCVQDTFFKKLYQKRKAREKIIGEVCKEITGMIEGGLSKIETADKIKSAKDNKDGG